MFCTVGFSGIIAMFFFSVKVTLIFIGLSFLPNSMLFCVTVGT